MAGKPVTVETLKFDNLALRALPVDSSGDPSQRQVPGACWSLVTPTPVKHPVLVCASLPALALLDLDSPAEIAKPGFVQAFSGNTVLPGSQPAAHCYCGHQFGYFSGQLGDGAAMYLGEVINSRGERWEIQLKGAGLTPFSRTADGRKVLRSSIREFLCSEAMYHLGIPTTRAGTCITSDSRVYRDIFYDGHPTHERCTIVLRIAPSFLRFGSFEIFKPEDSATGRKGPSVGRKDILVKMLDYAVENFYPEIWTKHKDDKPVMYVEFYKEVVRRTARMVAEWQCVGWCHGVLNTDNMSILGVTIDYGPFGFIDKFNRHFICNASDDGGRYTYARQPEMCKWNCDKFAKAIMDVVPLEQTSRHLNLFDEEFEQHYTKKMKQKLGLKKDLPHDGKIIQSFLDTMQQTGADFTNCFRCLSRLPLPGSPNFAEERAEVLGYLVSQSSSLEEVKLAYKPQMDQRQLSMFLMLAQANPDLVSALGKGHQFLAREMDKISKLEELENTTEEEVQEKNKEYWNAWLDKYSERLEEEKKGVEDPRKTEEDRKTSMNSVNPRFILRNYIAQNAIAAAEKGDYSEVQNVLTRLESPFSESVPATASHDVAGSSKASSKPLGDEASSVSGHAARLYYDDKPPAWAAELRVT
ncbi:selenoprotein o [Plakobranchus ocellatus]|uniref:Selenoprotein O n=1 Tax=Plakobranchus ocellatus TaxID=259542 RepID=A0AAV4DQ87_9GAST|nr:selenoprotein o [Plakobranchus ocellatus]